MLPHTACAISLITATKYKWYLFIFDSMVNGALNSVTKKSEDFRSAYCMCIKIMPPLETMSM